MKLFERKNVLYVEYKDRDDKRIRKSLSIEDTPKNREYALSTLIPKLRKELKAPRRYTLLSFLEKVLKDSEDKKPATYLMYQIAVKCIISHFGKNKKIDEINVIDIDDFIYEMSSLGLKATTIKCYLVPLGLALKEAMRLDVIQKNPIEYAKKPKVKSIEKEIFNQEEIKLLMDNATGWLRVYLHIAFYTGARVGEIVSLLWSDYDGKSLHIQRTLNKLGNTNLPKNGKKRRVQLPKALCDFLDNQERQDEWILGRQVNVKIVNHHFGVLQKQLGMTIRSTHTIRHTTTSLLLLAKENPMLIKAMLGHSSMDMINKVYGHHIEDKSDLKSFETRFLA